MFAIGDFARHGRVSVRMLRHYDAIGLLQPVAVDPETGYRYYEAAQLSRLNRIIALKDLGFTLQQVASVLDEQVSAAELRGMLILRRAELQSQISADTARLTSVEARLLSIEHEASEPAADVVIKRIAPVRVAELTAIAPSYEPESITPVIQPLYHDLFERLAASRIQPCGPGIAYYEDSVASETAVQVHATVTVAAEPGDRHDFHVLDLPELPVAATVIHRGSMDDVMPTGQALARWIDANGYRSLGYPRELTISYTGNRDEMVTELQAPIARTKQTDRRGHE
jgi:DNA-binding transcriptional MerR regulator